MKIYDAFLFFNELDLLEIRLNLLNGLVDHFVISESDLTFSGMPKPLYYAENKERFGKFEKKIIHQVIRDNPGNFTAFKRFVPSVNKDEECLNIIYRFIEEADNFPKDQLHWGRDFYQRECLRRALVNCDDDDLVIFSDLDEIPAPKAVEKVIASFSAGNIYTFRQKEFNYYLNMYKQDGWRGPRLAAYSILKQISLNKIRTILPGGGTLVESVDVPLGGWHFTNLGGAQKIIEKIESWGHQEMNTARIKRNVARNVAAGTDVFNRRGMGKLKRVEITEELFPKWLVDNWRNYPALVRLDDPVSPKLSFIEKLMRSVLGK